MVYLLTSHEMSHYSIACHLCLERLYVVDCPFDTVSDVAASVDNLMLELYVLPVHIYTSPKEITNHQTILYGLLQNELYMIFMNPTIP